MTGSIVSVRLPESMVKELKEAIKKDHYLDLSEAIRSIVRKRWMEWNDPGAYQIKKLREDIKEAVTDRAKKDKDAELLKELERIRDLIAGRGEEK